VEDYPFEGDIRAVGAFLSASVEGDQRPFGYYRIIRAEDGRTIGGIGFKGGPDNGRVEIGYGLAPSARGHGYAAEAVVALLAIAADHAVATVVAETEPDNVASQRTLVRAGFRRVDAEGALHRYEVAIGVDRRGSPPN